MSIVRWTAAKQRQAALLDELGEHWNTCQVCGPRKGQGHCCPEAKVLSDEANAACVAVDIEEGVLQ